MEGMKRPQIGENGLPTYEMFVVEIENKEPSSSQFPWAQMNCV